jgi:putative membrane protein
MRRLSFVVGLGILAAAWLGLPSWLVPGPFSAHMTLHMAVVALAAPLIGLGVAGGRWDPVRRWPAPFSAVLASIVELVLVWAWHTPALHQAARESLGLFVLEQASFLLSGLWLWLSAFGGGVRERDERAGSGILALLLTSMHMTLLGALLALPPRPLYRHVHPNAHEHAGHTVPHAAASAGLAPLDDQHLGGAIMIVLGGASYLTGGLWLAYALLRRRLGDAAERGGVIGAATPERMAIDSGVPAGRVPARRG